MKIHSTSIYNQDARDQLLAGAKDVYDAVHKTLGARGRTIVLWKNEETITLQDGVNIAKRVNPEDPYKNAGAEIIKQAAYRQVAQVGDGTTVTIILAYHLAAEAQKLISAGVNPMELKDGLEDARDNLVSYIKSQAQSVNSEKKAINIATISAKERELGRHIGSIFYKHGANAVVVAEPGGFETVVEHQDGVRLDAGYAHPFFVTNLESKMSNLKNPLILILNHEIRNLQPLKGALEYAHSQSRPLVLMVKDIDGDPMAAMLDNKMKGKLTNVVIKVPSFKREEIMQDIALSTGARVIDESAGMKLEDITKADFGQADKVQTTDVSTVIFGGKPDKKLLEARIKQLKSQLGQMDSDFENEKIRERLAKLTGGIYVIKVGGSSEVEINERLERADDAIKATKSALEHGYVTGGETIYLSADLKPLKESYEYAYRIMREAIKKPFYTLVDNAGYDPGRMYEKIIATTGDYGLDVTDGEFKDFIKAGIIDPASAPIQAITNAVSVATAIITSEGIVAEFVEKDK